MRHLNPAERELIEQIAERDYLYWDARPESCLQIEGGRLCIPVSGHYTAEELAERLEVLKEWQQAFDVAKAMRTLGEGADVVITTVQGTTICTTLVARWVPGLHAQCMTRGEVFTVRADNVREIVPVSVTVPPDTSDWVVVSKVTGKYLTHEGRWTTRLLSTFTKRGAQRLARDDDFERLAVPAPLGRLHARQVTTAEERDEAAGWAEARAKVKAGENP